MRDVFYYSESHRQESSPTSSAHNGRGQKPLVRDLRHGNTRRYIKHQHESANQGPGTELLTNERAASLPRWVLLGEDVSDTENNGHNSPELFKL